MMFQTFCQTLFHMTWTAAVAALGVMALRLVLKKRIPRWVVCALWLVVLLRMVCPVSFTLPVSLTPQEPSAPVISRQVLGWAVEEGTEGGSAALPRFVEPMGGPHEGYAALNTWENNGWLRLTVLWGVGAAGMLLWAGISYFHLRRRVADAVLVEDNVYESDRIESPFVCGLFRPRIYLPAGLPEAEKKYVLLHEGAHIARRDHIFKPLAWLALSVHWFNPVLWLGYVLYGRDVETACDQRVIRDFDRADTAGYAAALLHLGRRNAVPRAVPLAFGEENAKGRIRHVLDFKRPRLLVLLVAAIMCALVGILLLANPGDRGDQLDGVQMTDVRVMDGSVPVDLPKDLSHQLVLLIRKYDTENYSDLNSYLSVSGDVVLSDRQGGTVYYLTSSLDRELVLVRSNHDGYSWSSTRRGTTLTGMKDDPAYRIWEKQMQDYLTTGRADDLYALRTPYIGNHIAAGEILKALNVAGVAGPYTVELQTEKEPCGITLHLESFPALEAEQGRVAGYLHETGTLFVALVDNASFFHWDCVAQGEDGTIETLTSSGVQPGLQKPVDRAAFQALYDRYRANLGELASLAAGESSRYSIGEALYLGPEMLWRDMPMYLGDVTVAKDLFSVQYTHALSSAIPEADSYPNPIYHKIKAPDQIVLRDDEWPARETVDGSLSTEQAGADPVTWTGTLPLDGYRDRTCIAVHNFQNEDTGYRLYQLDGEIWLSWMDLNDQRNDMVDKAVWVFRLTDQPGVPLPGDEAE